jgi:hypothetical protein
MFEQFSKLVLIVLSYIVLTSLVYILPAIAISVIVWKKSLYFSCITNPAYAAVFGLISIIGVGAYMSSKADRGLI